VGNLGCAGADGTPPIIRIVGGDGADKSSAGNSLETAKKAWDESKTSGTKAVKGIRADGCNWPVTTGISNCPDATSGMTLQRCYALCASVGARFAGAEVRIHQDSSRCSCAFLKSSLQLIRK